MIPSCLLGACQLLSDARDAWHGTVIALFQPAEETAAGADAMVHAGLAKLVPRPDVMLAQHVLPFAADEIGTRTGPVLTAADSLRILLHGRGAHGSMPQAAVDPVVLAASIVVRLQSIVAREIRPGEPAVLTVDSIHAGTKSNVIPDRAELLLNIRTENEATRGDVLDAIRRIVGAECEAARCPNPPQFALYERFPPTINDADVTARVAGAFADFFGDRAHELPYQSASEDFSAIPTAFGVAYTYWGLGGVDPDTYRKAVAADRVHEDIPVNHSARFAPVIQPNLDTGIQALVVAARLVVTATTRTGERGSCGRVICPHHSARRRRRPRASIERERGAGAPAAATMRQQTREPRTSLLHRSCTTGN